MEFRRQRVLVIEGDPVGRHVPVQVEPAYRGMKFYNQPSPGIRGYLRHLLLGEYLLTVGGVEAQALGPFEQRQLGQKTLVRMVALAQEIHHLLADPAHRWPG